MITGSPYITNYSSRICVHAEITQTTYGQSGVAIDVKYDATTHNNLKLVCEPSTIFGAGTNAYNNYNGPKGRWGWLEKSATKGDIVEVVIQGLATCSNAFSSGYVGDLVTGFYLSRNLASVSVANGFEPGHLNTEEVDGAGGEKAEIQSNLGVLVKEGTDGRIIVWQGVQTPNISDYSHGEAHRVQAKLNGHYIDGNTASIPAGQAVCLHLDANGDLLARGGHIIGSGLYSLSPPVQDTYHINSGYWGITETGGAFGDVVDIVVAGHCQTVDTTTKAGGQISNIGPTGEIYALGGHVLHTDTGSSDNRTFQSASDWDEFNSPEGANATVATHTVIGGKLSIQSTTDEWVQGAELPNDELTDLEVGATYVVRVDLYSDTGTPSVFINMCGGTAGAQSISTSNIPYIFEVTITNTTGTLQILTTASATAYLIAVDNMYVMRKDATTLSDEYVHNSLGVTADDTGGVIIFPGVNRYDIRDYAESQVVTAVADVAIDTARKYPVSLYINKDGKLHAIIDSIANTFNNFGGLDNYSTPSNKWGIALETASVGDSIRVLVSGKLTDMDTTSDATWVAGDYLAKIAAGGTKERATGFEYEVIAAENDRTLESSSNWVVYHPETSITYDEDTANNRIAITGSGNGDYANSGGEGREGAHLAGTYLQRMSHDSTSMNTGYLAQRRDFLVTVDVWYDGGGTPPVIALCTGSASTTASGYFLPTFADGTNTVTSTQRTMTALVNSQYNSVGGTYENLVICQVNDTTDVWYFTNISVTALPHGNMQNKGVCLNADKKEWYLY